RWLIREGRRAELDDVVAGGGQARVALERGPVARVFPGAVNRAVPPDNVVVSRKSPASGDVRQRELLDPIVGGVIGGFAGSGPAAAISPKLQVRLGVAVEFAVVVVQAQRRYISPGCGQTHRVLTVHRSAKRKIAHGSDRRGHSD